MMHDRHGAGAPVVEPRPARAETTVPAGRQPSGDTVAWFDPVSGIAGDMALGALLDAGADLDFVAAQIDTLGLDGWKLGAERVTRNEIAATHAVVDAPEGHHHRRWRDIRELLVVSPLNERVRKRAMDVFEALAVAEGLVHGVPADEVHFHEVGALDAIVDIVGVCAALESLGVDAVCCGPVAVGKGTINAAHGVLPNPPPAVVNLLADRPIVGVDIDMELTTPTGAAIVAALAGHFGAAPAMTITSSGFGAGTRDLPGRPNVTGVLIGTVARSEQAISLAADMAAVEGASSTTELVELATNLDDVSGEVLGHAIDALLGAGALDAWAVPIVMKKGRPAYTLTALCRPEDVTLLADLAAQLTGTLGLRARTVVRTALERHSSTVDVDGHTIRVKHGPHRSKPEWDDVAAAAESLNRPPADIAREAGS
ncbi:MAG: nickel pincer cofactor biosynthesis protein LarC [Acidimicrobiales bacterium]|nr:nickel pincer cofactor biosynthesis protein LarC [Acidimicrobiales bacterium]MYG87994.1 nickel pincer cofactor biosynthesis protein LarC [Acidimicrobiales bacterium]MYI28367.1 nickel pincer cofactor biosynthesis protein LarC [Acidimicrobiales bacterium]